MDVGAILTPAEANPFSPGFGRTPHSLVGREDLLADLDSGLAAGPRDPRYASLLKGVRGSGKTEVLNELEDRAARRGWVILSADGSSRGLPERIVNAIAVTRGDSPSIGAAAGPQRGSRLQSFGLRLGVLSAIWHAGDDLPAQPVDADAQREALTIEDLQASVGKGPRLGSDDIADTYCSNEEFLAALDAPRRANSSSSP